MTDPTADPTPTESRVRRALQARASQIHPDQEGLTMIKNRVHEVSRRSAKARIGLLAAAAAVFVVAVVAFTSIDDGDGAGDQVVAGEGDGAPAETTSTTTEATDGTVAAGPVTPFVWDDRFDDPVAAAEAYAAHIGLADPRAGEFMQGDSRSGEVEVQPRGSGPVTLVLVRQDDDDRWGVIAAAAESITIESPTGLEEVSDPLTVSGTSTSFEANVIVEVHQDGDAEPVARDFTSGGANGEFAPFEITLDIGGASGGGWVLVGEPDASGEGTWSAFSVVRVRFAG